MDQNITFSDNRTRRQTVTAAITTRAMPTLITKPVKAKKKE